MKTVTVIVNVKRQSREFSDSRLAFWDAFATEAGDRRNLEPGGVEDYAARLEQRLKNHFPSALHRQISDALLSYRSPDDFHQSRASRVARGRLLLTVEAVRYGSLKIELGIPDIDAFIEVLGNNSEAFEALLGAYVPEAFNNCLPGDSRSLEFEVDIPSDVQHYINSPRNGKMPKSDGTAKEKGTAILTNLIQSPLIFPIILICFLWYYARQDMVDERRVTYGLVQTLVTEQTAVISLLKDKRADPAKDGAATERIPVGTAAQPKPMSNAEKEAK
jgi:hypothetical protein